MIQLSLKAQIYLTAKQIQILVREFKGVVDADAAKKVKAVADPP